MRTRSLVVSLAVLLVVLIGGIYALRIFAIEAAEKKFMRVHRNGVATPAQFGVAWTPLDINSEGRTLKVSRVVAPPQPACANRVALLVFHGRDESLSDWAKAQAFLSRQCVSSMVFDYSGNGNSTGEPSIANINADAIAAYRVFVASFPHSRRCVLGHSMGNAPMLHRYPLFAPAPDCVVVANAFSSVEDFASAGGAPWFFTLLLRGVWDNTQAIRTVQAPLMVVHSDADKTIPAFMSKRVDEAAPAQAQRITLHGFGHDALYEDPSLDWWKPVLTFVKE